MTTKAKAPAAIELDATDLIERLRRYFADRNLVVISKTAIPAYQGGFDEWSAGFNSAIDSIVAAVAAGEEDMAKPVHESDGAIYARHSARRAARAGMTGEDT